MPRDIPLISTCAQSDIRSPELTLAKRCEFEVSLVVKTSYKNRLPCHQFLYLSALISALHRSLVAAMERFVISQDVAKLLPLMQVVVVTASNVDNSASKPAVQQHAEVSKQHFAPRLLIPAWTSPMLRRCHSTQDVTAATLSSLEAYPNAQSHPRIALYRDTLKEKCNLSAKKFPQSNESLYKRILKQKKALWPLNPLVDFYNTISIKHAVTAGAFDIVDLKSKSSAPLELRMTRAGDMFLGLEACDGAEPAPVGERELAYALDNVVLTRHLAWRQALSGLVTSKTKDVIFVSEIFNEKEANEPTELARSVANDLVDGLDEFFGVKANATFLGLGLGKLSVEIS